MISEKELEEIAQPNVTLGGWQTEVESEAALDAILNEHPALWSVRQQVCGELIQPGYAQQDKAVRIDRILIPKPALLALGWEHGAIGVECKKSGLKIGQPIAQSTDYSRSLFKLESTVKIWLDYVFIWPMAPQSGPLASVLYQQRIGSAYGRIVTGHSWSKLQLKAGEHNVLRIDLNGSIEVGPAPSCRRAGSR